jgi:hypothetical protein
VINNLTTNTIQSSLALTSFAKSLASNPMLSFATQSLASKTMIEMMNDHNTLMEQLFKEEQEKRIQQFKEMEEAKLERLRQIFDPLDQQRRLQKFNVY